MRQSGGTGGSFFMAQSQELRMVTSDELQDMAMTGLKTWIYDCFLSTEQWTRAVTQTGAITTGLQQLLLNTGIQQGSEARANYARAWLNPLYGTLYFKLRLSGMADVFMFAGLTTTLTDPEWTKASPMPAWAQFSHAGIMVYQGALYFVTGDGDLASPQVRVTPITDADMTRWLVFKVEGDKFSWYSLPYTVPYFDKDVLPGIKQGIIRKWSGIYSNATCAPDDAQHYLVFYITNEVGANKTLEVQKVSYAEVYPD